MLYFNKNNNNKIMYFKILSVKKKYIDILLISPESYNIIVLKKTPNVEIKFTSRFGMKLF